MAKIWQINIYYWVLLIIFPTYSLTDDYTCSKKTECLCEFKNKNVLDISLINGSFKRDNILYEFSGCNKKLDKKGCENAMLCKFNETKGSGDSLGDSLNFVSLNGFGEHNITFSVNNTNTSTITLICTNGSNSTIFVDKPGSSNDFYIFSPHGCVLQYHASEGLSTGSVLILLLFIGCVFYFVGGAIILHCIRGARGKEMIPNIDFWQNLPGLVKDGLIFALNGCRPTAISTAESYDRI